LKYDRKTPEGLVTTTLREGIAIEKGESAYIEIE
jgi:hypothetical protein